MDLRNFEFYTSGNPVVGAAVTLHAASTAFPNPNAPSASTVTDANGMWQFASIADTDWDVRVEHSGKVKWIKALVRHGVNDLYVSRKTGVKATHSVAQAIPATTFTALLHNTEVRDDLNEYTPGTSTLVVGQTGWYSIFGSIVWDTGTAGLTTLGVGVNGTEAERLYGNDASPAAAFVASGNATIFLTAGDAITLLAFTATARSTFVAAARNVINLRRI